MIFPPRGFGSNRRLGYIAAAQQMLSENKLEREIVEALMDEGITEAKAYDYIQTAQGRIKRNKQLPEVDVPILKEEPFPEPKD